MDFNLFKAQFNDKVNGHKVVSLIFLNLILPDYCIEVGKTFKCEESIDRQFIKTAVFNLSQAIEANIIVLMSNQRKEITIETFNEYHKTILKLAEFCLKKL